MDKFRKVTNAMSAANALTGARTRKADEKLNPRYQNQIPEPTDDPPPSHNSSNVYNNPSSPRTPGLCPTCNQPVYPQVQHIFYSQQTYRCPNPIHTNYQQNSYPATHSSPVSNYTHTQTPTQQYSLPSQHSQHRPYPPQSQLSVDSHTSDNSYFTVPYNQTTTGYQNQQGHPAVYQGSPPPDPRLWSGPEVVQPPPVAHDGRAYSYDSYDQYARPSTYGSSNQPDRTQIHDPSNQSDQTSAYAASNAPSQTTQRAFSMPHYCEDHNKRYNSYGHCLMCGR